MTTDHTPDIIDIADSGPFDEDDLRLQAARGARRFARTLLGVPEYRVEYGLDEDDAVVLLGDVLADLMHLADELGLDWEQVRDAAERQYGPESKGEF